MTAGAPQPLVEVHPLTSARWEDLERLFGEKGAGGGCWCMWWRLTRSRFEQRRGEGNRQALKGIVDTGDVPGLVAYMNGEPAGWCSLGPREAFPRLERSRKLARVDKQAVWSIVCLYVGKTFRRQGVSGKLVAAAVQHAAAHGARTVEGYPFEPKGSRASASSAWTGLASTYREAGFVEVLRRSPNQAIMRYVVPA